MHYQPLSPQLRVSRFTQSPTIFTYGREDRKPIAFRHFVAFPAARALLSNGMPMVIGGRAFDLLLVLLRARGAIVSKEEIIRQVWPSTFVDAGNLRFQMTVLRKALGDDRDMIKTVTGRGYMLIDGRDEAEYRRGWTVQPMPGPARAAA